VRERERETAALTPGRQAKRKLGRRFDESLIVEVEAVKVY